jgi:hypothetical protein
LAAARDRGNFARLAQEIAGAALPQAFSRNGTFLVYRKLHENVYAFRQFINETAKNFGADFGIDNPMHAQERWRDGVPLSVAPTVEHWAESDPNARYAALRKFAFRSNPGGTHSSSTAFRNSSRRLAANISSCRA